MEQIRKLERTIDVDALFRWGFRKWKKILLIFLVAAIIGCGLGMVMGENTESEENIENIVFTEEEKDAIDEYLEHDIYIEEVSGIIDLLEKDIQEELGAVAEKKAVDESIQELSEKMKLLETYKSYCSSIAGTQSGLRNSFSDEQNAYIKQIEREEAGEINENDDEEEKENLIQNIKNGIKIGTLLGMAVAAIWVFAQCLMFGLNAKLKSKEDILAICGDIPVVEGKRDLIKSGKVKIGENLGIREFMREKEFGAINLAGKTVFDVDSWNGKLLQSPEMGNEESDVILIAEIGVSSYEDIIKTKEGYGERLIGGLCIR